MYVQYIVVQVAMQGHSQGENMSVVGGWWDAGEMYCMYIQEQSKAKQSKAST